MDYSGRLNHPEGSYQIVCLLLCILRALLVLEEIQALCSWYLWRLSPSLDLRKYFNNGLLLYVVLTHV